MPSSAGKLCGRLSLLTLHHTPCASAAAERGLNSIIHSNGSSISSMYSTAKRFVGAVGLK